MFFLKRFLIYQLKNNGSFAIYPQNEEIIPLSAIPMGQAGFMGRNFQLICSLRCNLRIYKKQNGSPDE